VGPQEADSSTAGKHYNYKRDYNPSIGRFLTSDPIGLSGGVNTYLYVEGKPLSFTDADGLGISFPGQPGPRDIVCGFNPAACVPRPPPPPSCFNSCMLRKVGFQAVKSSGVRLAAEAIVRWSPGWASIGTALGFGVLIPRLVPYAVPFFITYWTFKCIDECNTCMDAGNKEFSYP
jgi:RHS repeat-associated protein